MAGTDPVYYWDTCLFLAWIKDEARPSGEMDGVREVIARSKRRECKLVTSVITSIEVLACRLPAGVDHLFLGLMKRINKVGVDSKIAQLAHDLRNHYRSRETEFGGKTLGTPDAIHLATAILCRADEFHTFDRDGSKQSLGLLPLSGNVAGHRITICKPQARNPELDLGKPQPKTTPLSPEPS
jgi:predicted nucleic acid-binding protein